MMNRMILSLAAVAAAVTAAMVASDARAQAASPPARQQAAEPVPTPDPARIWRGSVRYRVTVADDTTGVDTAMLRSDGGHLFSSDRLHLMGTLTVTETRMALPSLAPVETTGTQEAGAVRGEVRLAYAGGRVRGSVALPGAAPTAIDAELPAGTWDYAGLPPLIMALPLRAGAVWTVPAYNPYVRAVTQFRVEVGAVETLETPMGPVRAFRVRLTGGPAEMLYWFSEAEPRWEVRGEIPEYGVKIEARSRLP